MAQDQRTNQTSPAGRPDQTGQPQGQPHGQPPGQPQGQPPRTDTPQEQAGQPATGASDKDKSTAT